MKKVLEFIAYLIEAVANHCIYVWGGQGQKAPKVCETWIRTREEGNGGEKVGGRYRTYADIAVEFWKAQVAAGFGAVLQAFDCSGLLTFFLLKMGLIKKDMSANGLMGLCKVTTERRAGYWIFRVGSDGRATHVGVLIDENTVIHAKGRAYGVVKEAFDAKYWHKIGIPSIFNFDEPAPEPTPTPSPEPSPKPAPEQKQYVRIKGKMRVVDGKKKPDKRVKVRILNDANSRALGTAYSEETYQLLGRAESDPTWYRIDFKGKIGYISDKVKYTEVVEK